MRHERRPPHIPSDYTAFRCHPRISAEVTCGVECEATYLERGIVLLLDGSIEGHVRTTAARLDLARQVRRRKNRMYTERSVLLVLIGGSNSGVKRFEMEIESVLGVS